MRCPSRPTFFRTTLHVSALNDVEYNLYTSSLNDLAISPDLATVYDDVRYESMSVGISQSVDTR